MELFGTLLNTRSRSNEIVNEWRIPAQSEGLARRQARANARIKNGTSSEVSSVTQEGSGSLPGQKIFVVETSTPR